MADNDKKHSLFRTEEGEKENLKSLDDNYFKGEKEYTTKCVGTTPRPSKKA